MKRTVIMDLMEWLLLHPSGLNLIRCNITRLDARAEQNFLLPSRQKTNNKSKITFRVQLVKHDKRQEQRNFKLEITCQEFF